MCVWHKKFKHEYCGQYYDSKNCMEKLSLQEQFKFIYVAIYEWNYAKTMFSLVFTLYIIFQKMEMEYSINWIIAWYGTVCHEPLFTKASMIIDISLKSMGT